MVNEKGGWVIPESEDVCVGGDWYLCMGMIRYWVVLLN